MKSIKIFLVLFVLFYMPTGTAWALQCISSTTEMVFGNGVDTTEREAKEVIDEIEIQINAKLVANNVELDSEAINEDYPGYDCNDITYDLQYNPTGGIVLDIIESIWQDYSTDVSTTLIWLAKNAMILLSDDATDRMVEIISKVEDSFALLHPVTQEFVTEYNLSLDKPDTRLIAVSHSQGNFFSNAIRPNLTETAQNNYIIVSVANPDSLVHGGFPHTTLGSDEVISKIRAIKKQFLLPEPLEANISNLFVIGDGHGFLDNYLASGSTSENQILNYMYNRILISEVIEQDPDPDPGECSPDEVPVPGGGCEYD